MLSHFPLESVLPGYNSLRLDSSRDCMVEGISAELPHHIFSLQLPGRGEFGDCLLGKENKQYVTNDVNNVNNY